MLESALHIATVWGYPVTWARPGTNIPGPPKDRDAKGEPIPNTGGIIKATCDVDVIRGWWAEDASRNISIACGETSGLLVLDIDRKPDGPNGFESLQRMVGDFGPLPVGPTVRTPNNGEQRYFRHPRGRRITNRTGTLHCCHADGTAKALYPGIDIRAHNAAACAPPSVRPEGSYVWLRSPDLHPLPLPPAWLLALIDPPAPPRADRKPLRVKSLDLTTAYAAAAFRGELAKLAGTGKGGRNLALFQAAANLGELVGAGILPEGLVVSHLEDAAADMGLVREDGVSVVRGTIKSGLTKGLAHPRELVR